MKQLIILATLFAFVACGENHPAPVTAVRPVKTTIAQAAQYIDKDFVGIATANNAVNLAFKVPGQILDVVVSTGQRVGQGQLLAELDPRDFQLTLEADRSAFEQAQSRLNRVERLLEREAVSRQEYEEALSSFARAKSTYENSREILEQTSLRAPFAAVVERVYVDNFERVQSGQTIVRIVEPLTSKVEFTIPESSLRVVTAPLTQFIVTFDIYPKMEFAATLTEYAVTTSDAAGFPVKLTVENPMPSIFPIAPGFSCSVMVRSEDSSQGAISLPLSAIYAPVSGGTYVWIVGANDIVERKEVVLGELYSSNRVIVTSGVDQGQIVVTAGVYQLEEGSKVKLIQ